MKSEAEIFDRIRERAEFLKPFLDQVEEERELWRQTYSGSTWTEEEIEARHRAYTPLVDFRHDGTNAHFSGKAKQS